MSSRQIFHILKISLFFMGALLTGCSLLEGNTNHLHQFSKSHPGEEAVAKEIVQVDSETLVVVEQVEYATIDGEAITGYLAYPHDKGSPRPGLIAIHELWGLNEDMEAAARQLASEGYTVLAVDLYGGQVAASPKNAQQLVHSVMRNPAATRSNLRQAYNYLMGDRNVSKVGVIGWRFGGAWSLQTALLLPDRIDATVIYQGELVTDSAELNTLQMPILGIFGTQDPLISVERVRAFESTLNELGKEAEIYLYDGAGPTTASSSDQPRSLTGDAVWEQMTAFLQEHLR